MAQGAWHGLRGPADFLIPDDTRELVYSGVGSAVTSSIAYVLNSREVTREISRMSAHRVASVYAANPGAVYPRAALRSVAQRQVARATLTRGIGLVLGGPVTTVAALYLFAASLPRQENVNPPLAVVRKEAESALGLSNLFVYSVYRVYTCGKRNRDFTGG